MKHRALWIKTGQILALAGLCLFSCLLYEAGLYLQQTALIQEQIASESWYGGWDAMAVAVSENDIQDIQKDPMIESVGTVETFDVECSHVMIRCGEADSAFFQQAGFRLKDGRYPEKAGEALVESSVLDELKRSYTLGQELKLELAEDEIQYVTIVGIIDPYRSGWTWGNYMPGLFTILPDVPVEKTCLLISAEEGWENSLPEKGASLKMTMNERLEQSPAPASTFSWTLVALAWTTAFLLPWIWLAMLIRQRAQDLSILKIRGYSLTQLKRILRNTLYLAQIPSLLLCLGCLFVSGWSALWLVVVLLSPVVVLRLCQHQLASIPAGINLHGGRDSLLPAAYSKTGFTMTVSQLSTRLNQIGQRQRRIQILALGLCMLSCILCLHTARQEQQQYTDIQAVPDFTLATARIEIIRHQKMLDNQQLDSISSIPGVQKILPAIWEHGWQMSWDDQENSCIWDILAQDGWVPCVITNQNNQSTLYPDIVVLRDGSMKTRVLDAARVSQEDFDSGKTAIISLPPFQSFYNKEPVSGEIRTVDLLPDRTVWEETSIQPGTTITLSDSDHQERQLTIAGILRDPPSETYSGLNLWDRLSGDSSPYTLFVDESFLPEAASTVHVWTDPAAGRLTEKHISELASRLDLTLINRFPEKTAILQNLRFQYLLLYVLAAAAALAVVLVLIQLWRQQNRKLTTLCLQLNQLFLPPVWIHDLEHHFRMRLAVSILAVLILGLGAGWLLSPDVTDPAQVEELYYHQQVIDLPEEME
ncbi:hypothetical protein [uncultured Faecalibaculum sp.]|uniref:hypothetical protein n=2 Tax=uncultured Faecalibaculum sp. TaxID=1729681 RepID=UPI0025E3EB30|nr:hypothetical protein [uncultured Faecalibaculum sp.]